jgi:hypothetical protein
MSLFKKIACPILCSFFYFAFSNNLFARNCNNTVLHISSLQRDTGKVSERRLNNKKFNELFIQNLRPSFAGQEFFDPRRTLLVADLAPAFIFFNSPKIPFFFVATARVNLRLLADHGSPVQSPSYMPEGTFYFRTNKDYYKPNFMSVSYTHHSNGVRGPTLNPDGSINTDSGKFTTNFYTITYHYGKRTGKENIIINRYDAIGLELHSGLLSSGYATGLKGRYGFVRINGDWLYNIAHAVPDPIDNSKKSFENWQRWQFDFAYIADKYDNYSYIDIRKRLNISLKYYRQFPFMQNVSVLVGAGYRGQDDGNIFFQNSYAYVTIGFAAGISLNFDKNQH